MKNSFISRVLHVIVFTALMSIICLAQPSPGTPPAAADAQSDVILRALQDELARSMKDLQFRDFEKPYFIEYEVSDIRTATITGTFGGLVYNNRDHNRALAVEVRVGSYDFDNEPSGYPSQIVIEDNYNALRHELWLATDAAYRQAVESLARKRAFLKNRTEEEKIPDFSREEPVALIAARQSVDLDEKQWQSLVREWSAIFREFPVIKQSNVSFQFVLVHKYLVNSEGTRVRRPSVLVTIEASGYTQAADGMWLSHGAAFYATSLNELPAATEIARAIRRAAQELTDLQKAPVIAENYLGPVLFTGGASAEMFAQLLAPELCSQRPSVGASVEDSSSLTNRVNRRVLPPFLSVFDDPTQQRNGENSPRLLGSYEVDDQGVTSRRVSLIEQGILKNLLMSRRPRKNSLHSTGHGRSAFVGNAATTFSNLFIQPTSGRSFEELRQELIKTCKLQSLSYGFIIKSLGGSRQGGGLSDPTLAYKVYVEDGREELVRGVNTGELTLKDLRQLLAVGNDGHAAHQIRGMGRGSGITSTIIAPSVLVEELELKKPVGTQQKPLLLTHPYFAGK